MNSKSAYLKQSKTTAINWMKPLVYFAFFLAVLFNLINRAATPMLYCFFVVSAVYILMNKNIRLGKYTICLIAFLLYALIACFWSIAPNPVQDIIRLLLKYVVFAFLLYNVTETKKDCENYLRLFCLAGLGFSIFSTVFYGLPHVLNAIMIGERLGEEICGINSFGLYAGLAFSLCLYFAKYQKRYHYYLFSILPFVLVLASSSRKAMLLVFCAILYFFAFQKLQKSFRKGIILVAVIFGSVFLILQLPAFAQVLQRLEIFFETTVQGSASADKSTDIRMQLIEIGLQLFKNRPLFGNGTNAFRYIASGFFAQSEISAHNTYVDILANFGIIGFISYYLPILIVAWGIFKGVLREIPEFYCMFFLIVISAVLLDMSYVSYHFIVPYAFYPLFDRASELYRTELKEKRVQQKPIDAESETSKYLK